MQTDITQENILIDADYFAELIASIDAAKETIDLEVYIFEDDIVGQEVAAALMNAAQRGVKVRVVVDGFGSPNWGNALTQTMEKSGIATRVYHPLPWLLRQYSFSSGRIFSFISKLQHYVLKLNKRTHRKMSILDNNIAFVGSANIKECFETSNGDKIPLRDASVKISNVDTQILQYAFDRIWRHFSIYPGLERNFYKDSDPRFRLNFTWRLRYRLYAGLLRRIKHSHKRIWIANAYFVANKLLLNRLIKAAKRGVDVQIILPSKYEMSYFSLLTHSFYTMLLDAGVKIYEYQPGILHEKIIMIDDWYCLGSSNLNYRSYRHDLEIDANLRTENAQAALQSHFLSEKQSAKQIHKTDVKHLSWAAYLLGRILLLLKYWM